MSVRGTSFGAFKLQTRVAGNSCERCCVPYCSSSSRYNTTVSFHRFPKNTDLRSEWLGKIRREDLTISKHTTVCSRHFRTDEINLSYAGKRMLRSDAVPTLFEWNEYSVKSRAWERGPTPDAQVESRENSGPGLDNHSCAAGSTVCENKGHVTNEPEERRGNVESFHLQTCFRFSASPEDVHHYTRFQSYEHLMVFWSLIEAVATKMVRVTAKKESTSAETPTSTAAKLRPLDEFFLFLTFLSTGSRQAELAQRFEIHPSTVNPLIVQWANLLFCILGTISMWTSPAAPSFICEDPRVLLDCVELQCQTQGAAFPKSKSHGTLKAMVGVSPHGALVFVSSLFEGPISDREVFRRSGVTGLLPPDSDLMVDKGFRSSSSSERAQTPAEDETQSKARPRGLVERAICRVKENKLFDSAIPLSITGSINQIFTVACLLSNYQHGPQLQDSCPES